MSLQLALTQLESLAELLNERKREAEQTQAFKEVVRAISVKLPKGDNNRCLIRQDDVIQLVSILLDSVMKYKCVENVTESLLCVVLLTNEVLQCTLG